MSEMILAVFIGTALNLFSIGVIGFLLLRHVESELNADLKNEDNSNE